MNEVIIKIPYFPFSSLWAIWAIALIFVLASCGLSFLLIYKHLKYYTQPDHQRYIVRILCMVPLYAVYSLLSLVFHEYQLYFGIARDCYEAYVLYMFFALCVNYAGGSEVLTQHYLSQPKARLPAPLFCKVPLNELFLRVCRQGMLQYVLLRPIVSLWSTVLEVFDLYNDGEFRYDRGYMYGSIINNICVTIALYVVVLFYQASAEVLAPYKPILKFITIKIVVFFCFWQSVAIAIMVHLGWIPPIDGWSVGEVATGLQNFLICFEMFLVALMHIYAYPYELYRVRALSQAPLLHRVELGTVLQSVANMTNQSDVYRDTVESFGLKKKGDKKERKSDDKKKKQNPDATSGSGKDGGQNQITADERNMARVSMLDDMQEDPFSDPFGPFGGFGQPLQSLGLSNPMGGNQDFFMDDNGDLDDVLDAELEIDDTHVYASARR